MTEPPNCTEGENLADVVGGIGQEHRALLARGTIVLLLQFRASLCLLSAAASLAGYLPHAPALFIASVAGFVLSFREARMA